jgi:hypothetical protein
MGDQPNKTMETRLLPGPHHLTNNTKTFMNRNEFIKNAGLLSAGLLLKDLSFAQHNKPFPVVRGALRTKEVSQQGGGSCDKRIPGQGSEQGTWLVI